MKYYTVAHYVITSTDWLQSYAENVTRMVEERGGKFLTRTSAIEVSEGNIEPRTNVLVIEWPSKEVFESFQTCEEFRPFAEARKAGSKGTFLLVPGQDDAKQATI